MIEIRLDEVKVWLVVVTWHPLWRSRYYNCFPFQTQAPLSMKFVEEELGREPEMRILNVNLEWKPWMGTLNKNSEWSSKYEPWMQTQWNISQFNDGKLKRKTKGLMRIFQPWRKADESQTIMLLVKNFLPQWWETGEKNRIKDQSMKNLQDLIEEV